MVRRTHAAGTVALSVRPGGGYSLTASGGGDHAREAHPASSRRIALCDQRGDGELDRTQGRLGAHRADDLCATRQPEGDRAGAGRANRESHRRGSTSGARAAVRKTRASLSLREGARRLAGRARAVVGHGIGFAGNIVLLLHRDVLMAVHEKKIVIPAMFPAYAGRISL